MLEYEVDVFVVNLFECVWCVVDLVVFELVFVVVWYVEKIGEVE